jgi:aromatic ring hydroxylase
MISDFMASSWSGVQLAGQYHGGGSPIMETIGLLRDYDLKAKTDLVKYLAGISLNDPHG